MSDSVISCPCCRSNRIVNGFIHNRNQNFKCKDCGRKFVLDPKNNVIGEETKNLIDAPTIRKNPLSCNCAWRYGNCSSKSVRIGGFREQYKNCDDSNSYFTAMPITDVTGLTDAQTTLKMLGAMENY